MRTISSIFAPQNTFQHEQCKDGEKDEVAGTGTFTARELEVVKTNLATYKTRKAAEIL